MKIIIFTDNEKSWFVPFGRILQNEIEKIGYKCDYIFDKDLLYPSDITFILSCTKIIPPEKLHFNKHNIVVHASDLPEGKGFSPLQWQILEGRNEIILTLFEAVKEVDAGPYFLKKSLKLTGYELLEELREKMATKIIEMCVDFVKNKETYPPIPQIGKESFYRRRIKEDDNLDINKTIKEHFNHFRIADNDNFPLHFYIDGKKYYLKIFNN